MVVDMHDPRDVRFWLVRRTTGREGRLRPDKMEFGLIRDGGMYG